MIPEFPEGTRPGDLSRSELLGLLPPEFPPYSDLSPGYLQVWNLEGRNLLSRLGGNVVFRTYSPPEARDWYTLAGTSAVGDSLRILADEHGITELDTVPVETAALAPSQWSKIPHVDEHDYVIDLARPFHPEIRRKIRKARRILADTSWAFDWDVEPTVANKAMRSVAELWSAANPSKAEQAGEEADILEHLDLRDHPSWLVGIVSIEGQPHAFAVLEVTRPGWVCFYFGKNCSCHPDLGTLIDALSYRELAAGHGARRVNMGPDLGIPGLRRYKRRWAPGVQLQKYKLLLGP